MPLPFLVAQGMTSAEILISSMFYKHSKLMASFWGWDGWVTWEGRTPPPWLVVEGMTSAETSPGRWPPLPVVPALLVTPRMLPVVAARIQNDTSAPGRRSRAHNMSNFDGRKQRRAAHQPQSAADCQPHAGASNAECCF